MKDVDPMVDFRDTRAPRFGLDARLDALSFAVCTHAGHIPNFTAHRPEEACDFHRRMAQAFLAVVDRASP